MSHSCSALCFSHLTICVVVFLCQCIRYPLFIDCCIVFHCMDFYNTYNQLPMYAYVGFPIFCCHRQWCSEQSCVSSCQRCVSLMCCSPSVTFHWQVLFELESQQLAALQNVFRMLNFKRLDSALQTQKSVE